jgi:uncharacterized repeat protein (TIGR01451 family)
MPHISMIVTNDYFLRILLRHSPWDAMFLSGLNLKIPTIAALLTCVLMHCAAEAADASGVSPTGQPSPLDITLTVKKIVRVHGEDRRLDASHAEPGDVLEYRAEYKNIGETPLSTLSATLPLPEHTELVIGSVYPAGAEVSRRSAKEKFSLLPVTEEGGRGSRKDGASSGAQYGALRWNIEKLAPGKIVAVGARVRVENVVSERTPAVPLNVQTGSSILQ